MGRDMGFHLRTSTSRLVRGTQVAALVFCVGALGACSSLPSLPSFGSTKKADAVEEPPEAIYGRADQLLEKGSYEDAAARFEEVDRQHPYSPFARRAIAMSAYANYKAGKYPEAIAAAKRYTTLHPGTKDAALAHHVIASSYFDQMNDAKRDQNSTKLALRELETLVRQYPNSPYAKRSQNRIRIARDTLAAQEMEVGRYYLKRKNYLAAINRFKTVVVSYQTTTHVEEALARLTEAYMALGITPEAQTATAILGHNYPSSQWYKDSYALLASGGLKPRASSGSWITRAVKSTVKTFSG